MRNIFRTVGIQVILLVIFLALMTYITITQAPAIGRLAGNPELFRQHLFAYGSRSVLVFIGLQAAQVIVAAIPGELMQIAGGYVYGTLWGTVYSLAGIAMGSIIVFYISRWLGYPLLKRIISPARLDKFTSMINSSRSEMIIFILFLIPGMPKDMLSYIAGTTPVRPAAFLFTSTLARLPGILTSAYIGSHLQKAQYGRAALVSVLALLLFAAGLLLKDKIMQHLQR